MIGPPIIESTPTSESRVLPRDESKVVSKTCRALSLIYTSASAYANFEMQEGKNQTAKSILSHT